MAGSPAHLASAPALRALLAGGARLGAGAIARLALDVGVVADLLARALGGLEERQRDVDHDVAAAARRRRPAAKERLERIEPGVGAATKAREAKAAKAAKAARRAAWSDERTCGKAGTPSQHMDADSLGESAARVVPGPDPPPGWFSMWPN